MAIRQCATKESTMHLRSGSAWLQALRTSTSKLIVSSTSPAQTIQRMTCAVSANARSWRLPEAIFGFHAGLPDGDTQVFYACLFTSAKHTSDRLEAAIAVAAH